MDPLKPIKESHPPILRNTDIVLSQSVANNFSDEQIWIWILFVKDIFYTHEYEYYSWHLLSRIWIRILFVKNIHEYIRIFEYIQIFENNQTSGYCYLPVWRWWIWYHNSLKLSILLIRLNIYRKNSPFIVFYYIWWIWSVANIFFSRMNMNTNNIHNLTNINIIFNIFWLPIRIWILFVRHIQK